MSGRARWFATGAGTVALAGAFLLGARAPAIAQAVEAALFRDADNPALQPFQAFTSGRVWGAGRHPAIITHVPEGKRLVIEYVSTWITDYGSAHYVLEVNTFRDGRAIRHMVPLVQQVNNSTWTDYIAGQPVKLYADPDTDVVVAVQRTGYREASDISTAISGHLVNLR